MKYFVLSFLLWLMVPVYADDSYQDIQGYDKTDWNMSVDEVKRAEHPKVVEVSPPEVFKTGVALLAINEIEIASNKFKVLFLFDEASGKLSQVNIKGYESKNAGINALVFSSLEKLLTEKYGTPSYKNDGREVSWKLSKTTIVLSHLNIPRVISQVTVMYKPISATDSASSSL